MENTVKICQSCGMPLDNDPTNMRNLSPATGGVGTDRCRDCRKCLARERAERSKLPFEPIDGASNTRKRRYKKIPETSNDRTDGGKNRPEKRDQAAETAGNCRDNS